MNADHTAALLVAAARAQRQLQAARQALYADLRARMAAGETAYSLAKETGLSQTALAKIRRGELGR